MKKAQFMGMGMDVTIGDDKLNHRFRGYVKNQKNEIFFIEIGIRDISRYALKSIIAEFGVGTYIYHIDHLFRLQFEDTNYDPEYAQFQKIRTTATKNNIIKDINNIIGSKYKDFEILEWQKDDDYNLVMSKLQENCEKDRKK